MLPGVLLFALGVLLCQMQAELRLLAPALVLAGVAALLWLLVKAVVVRRMACCALALLCGLAWAEWRAQQRLAEALPPALEGQALLLSGRVSGLVERGERWQRFEFLPDASRPEGVPPHLEAYWYAGKAGMAAVPVLRAGEHWRLELRLRRPHGYANPGGFDYEAWMFARGIGASAQVRGVAQRTAEAGWPGIIDRARAAVLERFARALPDAPWRGVLAALAVGAQGEIPQTQWALFRATGITHLVSISGLHVTMLAALAAALAGGLWRRVPALALRCPAQRVALPVGCLAAALYVLLAGSAVPAQRTLYMLLAGSLAQASGRAGGPARALAFALLVVLLIDPWAVLAAGFWLSFGAVAALLLVAAPREAGVRWQLGNWLRAQWAVSLGALPLMIALFQQVSLSAPLANALAIPVVSFLLTPLCVLFAVLPLPLIAQLAHALCAALMAVLVPLAALPGSMWQQAEPPLWLLGLGVLGALWSLMPRGFPARGAAALVMLPVLSWQAPRPLPGDFALTVLDVGQGLAVHVQTAQHDLLFDTGPRLNASDAGERVLLPYLRARGVARLDALVVSHADADHAGGAATVLAGLPVRQLWLGGGLSREAFPPAVGDACTAGKTWQWEGVSFAFLHPDADFPWRGNDASCVLLVRSAGAAALLPGDAEAAAEAHYLAGLGSLPAQRLIVAPHHGAAGASSNALLQAFKPTHVAFTAGYRNRYHHPAADTVARYAAVAAASFRTDSGGALDFAFTADGLAARCWREAHRHYWSAPLALN